MVPSFGSRAWARALVFGVVAVTARASAEAPPSGAAGVEPDAEGADALRVDLERIVTTAEAGGWYVDRTAYDEIHPVLLESVCKASFRARADALAAVRARALVAGDPRRVFSEEGRRTTSRFHTALTLDRMQRALERALVRAEEDCPFWEVPQHGFRSRQTDYRKFTLSLETGGNIQLRQTAGSWTFGGGGLGRILPGFGFDEHLSVLFGVEFGGGAMLRPGGPETEFVVNYFPAIPVVLRYRDVNWHYDVEAGLVSLFQADNTRLSYGGRIGTSIGVFATRTRNLLPWAGIAGTYEYYFESGGRPAAHFIRGGLRVGVLWDL